MTRRSCTVAAIDLGASNGRVAVGRCLAEGMVVREVYRFPNVPVQEGGFLRWDVAALQRGVLGGLRRAAATAGPLDAVGVDGWGVDYGLFDGDGRLIDNPIHYRDPRSQAAVADVLERVSAADLYAATGSHLQPFNTVFQLVADRRAGRLDGAGHAALVPDLMTSWLGGSLGTELTNASTTGLLDPSTLDWSATLMDRLGLSRELFGPLRKPGVAVARMRPEPALRAKLEHRPQVVTVPSHDTAAAVAAVPAESSRFAYVCTGTWALVGVELPSPVIDADARAANFTNELGADGSIRFLRNVAGFWVLQECLREWRAAGLDTDIDDLTRAAALVSGLRAVIDVQDPELIARGGMSERVERACRHVSGRTPTGPAEIMRCILDGMALAVRHAVREAQRLSGHAVDVVHVVGGGVSNRLFCQLVADACRLPVLAGPVEAASWGNVIYQARALGMLDGSAGNARALVRRAEPPVRYHVRGDERAWDRADALIREARGVRA